MHLPQIHVIKFPTDSTGIKKALHIPTDMATNSLLRSALPATNLYPTVSARLRTESLAVVSWRHSSIRAMGSSPSSQRPDQVREPANVNPASLNDDEWKKRLTKEQYYITRQKGTERAFTGEYWNTKTPGTYHCICCDTPLFESNTKFDSGTGWPSYYEPVSNNVKSKLDMSIIFMPRTEVLCATCNAHLGHFFDDGPLPTGKRYCINSASLKLKPK